MRENANKARSYTKIKNRIKLFELVFTPIILFAIVFSGINRLIESGVLKIVDAPYLGLIFYLITFGLFIYTVDLPVKFFSSFILEHRFGLSNQTFFSWAKREAKSILICLAIGLIFSELVYFFIRNFGNNWWFLTALIWIILAVFLSKFAPIIILPLFYKVKPIKEGELNNRILRLTKKSGTAVKGIFEIDFSKDTKKANAALVGIGKTRRIILCDTLLKNFSIGEIETVLAHELGHHKNAHIKKLLVFSSIIAFINLYLMNLIFIKTHDYFKINRVENISSLPLLLLIVMLLGILIKPLLNAYSRRLETSADIFALELTKDPHSFINTMRRLAEQNLSDISPNRFVEIMLYDHPPISKRIELAERYK